LVALEEDVCVNGVDALTNTNEFNSLVEIPNVAIVSPTESQFGS
jgi:hypothetical protein